MSDIKQYDYAHSTQRRMALFNILISAILGGIIFVDLLTNLNLIFPYMGIFGIVGSIYLGVHLTGILTGKYVFSKIKKSRHLYILTEALFILGIAAYLVKNYFFGSSLVLFSREFVSFPLLSVVILALIPFITGIKNNYLLRVSCGTFFDERKGAVQYVFLLTAGFVFGMLVHYFSDPVIPLQFFAILIAPLFPMLFFIKADYVPTPFLAQNIGQADEKTGENDTPAFRDDIFFSYLNFSCVVIYTFLAGKAIFRYYGDLPPVKVLFISLVLVGLATGYGLAALIKRSFLLHIYAEIIYPFFFIGFFLAIHLMHDWLSVFKAFILYIPVLILFGMSLHYSIRAISERHSQARSYSIINFSVFILPVPILVSILLIPFTQMVYFIFFYSMTLINIIIPGVYIAQKNISELRKGLYFIFAVSVIPFFIFLHFYFSVPFSSKPFQERVSGFNEIIKINYNADFIQKTIDVTINGKTAFHVSDQTVRNTKQATAVIALFSDYENDSVLFIDGTRKFFVNPVQALFRKAVRLDYIPRDYTGYMRIPSTTGEIANIEKDLVLGLSRIKRGYDVIVDNPNIYDQQENPFRFSSSYYDLVKKYLTGKRIFVQTFDIARCDRNLFTSAMESLSSSFPHSVVFVFGETLVVVCSDKSDSIVLNEKRIQQFKNLLSRDAFFSTVFSSELQCISHVWTAGYPQLKTSSPAITLNNFTGLYKNAPIGAPLPDDFSTVFVTSHSAGIALFEKNDPLKSSIEQSIKLNEKILTLIKKAEVSSLAKDYEGETLCLLELKKYGEYNQAVRQYVSAFLTFRETSFNDVALLYEKDKQWEDAAKIYRSMLLINPNNFDANYKMSIISLTLQNINDAFKYLQTAMHQDSNNPNVMHQMGVILFTTGKYNEALVYLQKAVALKKYDASTYYYIGLCYEELGKLSESDDYYKQALLKDPSNQDITSALERVKGKLDRQKEQWHMPERKNQNEVEHGEDFPLPINKSAIDVRLKDENSQNDAK